MFMHIDEMKKVIKPVTEFTLSQVQEKGKKERKKELHCSQFPKPHIKVTSG